MEKIPLMSPAKMFAYMKERESKREQQNFQEVSSSIREVLNGGESIFAEFGLSWVSVCMHVSIVPDTALFK